MSGMTFALFVVGILLLWGLVMSGMTFALFVVGILLLLYAAYLWSE